MITELSDECDLPTREEYMRQTTKEQLQNYLIRDVIGIVQQYTDWNNFYGEALFSVPLEKFKDRNDILFFRRTDKRDYTINYAHESIHKAKIPGHFELNVNLRDADIIIIDDDHPTARYLVGLNNTNTQPKEKSEILPEILLWDGVEEFRTSLEFRSPSYLGVRTVNVRFIQVGRIVYVDAHGLEPEGTVKTNQGFMISSPIPSRVRPSCATYVAMEGINNIQTRDRDGNVINRDLLTHGIGRIGKDGTIMIIASQKFTNLQKFGFQTFHIQWCVSK